MSYSPVNPVNTTGFLLAVLKHIALVKPLPDKPRCYEFVDSGPWLAEMETLMASSADETPDAHIDGQQAEPTCQEGQDKGEGNLQVSHGRGHQPSPFQPHPSGD